MDVCRWRWFHAELSFHVWRERTRANRLLQNNLLTRPSLPPNCNATFFTHEKNVCSLHSALLCSSVFSCYSTINATTDCPIWVHRCPHLSDHGVWSPRALAHLQTVDQEAPQDSASPSCGHLLESAEVELVCVVPEEHLATIVLISTAGHKVQRGHGGPNDPVLLQPGIPGIQDGLDHELKLHRSERHTGDTSQALWLHRPLTTTFITLVREFYSFSLKNIPA